MPPSDDDGEKLTVGADERTRAEDYRRQKQKREAEKIGINPIDPKSHVQWLAEHEHLLEAAARAGGATDAEIPSFVAQYKEAMQNDPEGSEYDDPHAVNIINRVVKEVEAICLSRKIPIRSGVVFGVTPSFGVLAHQQAMMTTDMSVIGLSIPFFVFAGAITKAMAKSLVYANIRGALAIDNTPAEVRKKLQSDPELIRFWVDIFRTFGGREWPIRLVEPSLHPHTEAVGRILLLRAVELFSIAHEYGHHVSRHGISDSTEADADSFNQEHEADIFARAVCVVAEPHNSFATSGVGGILVLGALDLVRRTTSLLETGKDIPPPRRHHPPYPDRVAVFAKLDEMAPQFVRESLAQRRACFFEIMEIIWEIVRPDLLQLHQEGARPKCHEVDAGGWLPLS